MKLVQVFVSLVLCSLAMKQCLQVMHLLEIQYQV